MKALQNFSSHVVGIFEQAREVYYKISRKKVEEIIFL